MAELVLDVYLELDPLALARQPDPTRAAAELSRLAAERKCDEARAVLRHPDPRNVVVKRASDLATGAEVLLVATRWLADGPQPRS